MRRILILIFILTAKALYSQNNWLSKIDDNTPVANISVPGTHNSATGNGLKWGINIGVTQELNIDEQWDIGIRAFDLRPDIGKKDIYIYHSLLKTKITFREAVETIIKKLDAAPNEFAIIIMRQERFANDSEKREQWSCAVGAFIESLGERAVYFHPQITAGEMRGKILFISRSHYSACKKGAYIKGWSHSLQGTNDASLVSYNSNQRSALWVQDFYAPLTKEEQQEKLNTIKSHIGHKAKDKECTWSINYLSGYSSTLFGIDGIPSKKGYLLNAGYIHKQTIEFLENCNNNSGIGIIMLDYAGCEKSNGHTILGKSIVERIIESNF